MRRATALQSAGRGRLTSAGRQAPCPRDVDQTCFTGTNKPITFSQAMAQPLIHMDDCTDPECPDLEQLGYLQKSLDRFTDYDHYERCCDGHHRGRHHYEPCCNDNDNACSIEQDVCTVPDCVDSIEDCDECADEHANCFEEIDVCEEDCEQCEEECEERGHTPDDCPQNHPTTRDNCIASHNIPLPLLGPTDDFDLHGLSLQTLPALLPVVTPCTDNCHIPIQQVPEMMQSVIQEPTFDMAMDHWQTFVQKHHCAPDPCLISPLPPSGPPQHVDPAFGFSFSCDPSIASNQYPWQLPIPQQVSQCAVPIGPVRTRFPDAMILDTKPQFAPQPSATPSTQSPSRSPSVATTPSANAPDRVCQWLMPCGSICGASYTRTEDLKKHVKNSHGLKGTTTCRWESCTATFATEAALTGHISKKHLSPIKDEEGPWKCTLPGCTKSFMYKQVRDEHVASHNGGNRMHCPICHQWLNAEGSNFRRHMASHGPKNEHMKCRFETIGCKRSFPRLDNLRRHEACCKFGKRAAGVHHHHHHVHVGHVG